MNKTNRVLLIEKDELLADITALRLELLGFKVHCAQSIAAACVQVANEPRFALLLIDLDMEGDKSEGLSMIQKSVAAATGTPSPVLVLTGDVESVRQEIIARSGTEKCDFLPLPYNPFLLEQKISQLLGRPVPSAVRARNSESTGITENEAIAT